MKTERRRHLKALAALALAAALPVRAEALDDIRARGRLRVAVYKDFPPYSHDGRGIDVDLGQALAERLGLRAEFAWFNADEDMNDDLRNMVWKGHYLGTQPADVMLHVPVDAHLAALNDKVRIFGPYHLETVAMARDAARVPPPAGSAAIALEVFTREKIGVETTSGSDAFLLGVLRGRLRDNVVHYRSVAQAAAGLKKGEVAAVMAPRAELEAALGGAGGPFAIGAVRMPELRNDRWPLGLAVKNGRDALADALAEALIGLQREGAVARIFASHGITHLVPGG